MCFGPFTVAQFIHILFLHFWWDSAFNFPHKWMSHGQHICLRYHQVFLPLNIEFLLHLFIALLYAGIIVHTDGKSAISGPHISHSASSTESITTVIVNNQYHLNSRAVFNIDGESHNFFQNSQLSGGRLINFGGCQKSWCKVESIIDRDWKLV